MKNTILSTVAALSFLISCQSQSRVQVMPEKVDIKDIVNDSEVTIVDVRIPEEYKESTAHNAINIPLAEIENNLDFFKNQKKVVLFCNRGIQAGKALDILKKNGVENVYTGTTWKNVKAIQEENNNKTIRK